MSDTWHVLVTGPVTGLEEWVQAAGAAGWRATAFPLVEIAPTDTPVLAPDDPLPDWIAVTSANALAALADATRSRPELRAVPLCCVGESTAARAVALGLPQPRVPAPGAQDAGGLAATLLEHAAPNARVLWPRGDRAAALGERLEAAGLVVTAPVVYRTRLRALESEPPDADAVFFASSSAVLAWRAEERSAAPAAIAIGWTTYDALEPVAHRFSMVLPLATPSTASFRECLQSFFPSTR